MKTYIWSLPTRLFHWMLAISFTAVFISGGEEEILHIHTSLGLFIGVLVLFRLVQGVTGPRYVRFADFPISPRTISDYLRGCRARNQFPGHNPLAAMVMLAIMITALLSALSGLAIVAGSENGFLGLKINPPFGTEGAGEFHEVAVHVFLVLTGLHLSGLMVDLILDRPAGTIYSIFTGYKRLKALPAVLTPAQKVFSFFWLIIPVILLVITLLQQHSTSTMPAESREKTEHPEDND